MDHDNPWYLLSENIGEEGLIVDDVDLDGGGGEEGKKTARREEVPAKVKAKKLKLEKTLPMPGEKRKVDCTEDEGSRKKRSAVATTGSLAKESVSAADAKGAAEEGEKVSIIASCGGELSLTD